jgi:hypothetical protein
MPDLTTTPEPPPSRLDSARQRAREALAEARADRALDKPVEDYPFWYGRVSTALEILLDALDDEDA